MIHRNETYFPDPTRFDPTRWLDPKEVRRIDKAFVPFGKGSRGCAGIKYVQFLMLSPKHNLAFSHAFSFLPSQGEITVANYLVHFSLAYCELYVTLGTLFRNYGEGKLKGNDLTEEDLTYNDYFSAQNAIDAKKFHVSAVK